MSVTSYTKLGFIIEILFQLTTLREYKSITAAKYDPHFSCSNINDILHLSLVRLLCFKVLLKYIAINKLFMVTISGDCVFLFIPRSGAGLFYQLSCFFAIHWKAWCIQHALNASFTIIIIAELGDIYYPFQHLLMR
jgi:hypothetical protein